MAGEISEWADYFAGINGRNLPPSGNPHSDGWIRGKLEREARARDSANIQNNVVFKPRKTKIQSRADAEKIRKLRVKKTKKRIASLQDFLDKDFLTLLQNRRAFKRTKKIAISLLGNNKDDIMKIRKMKSNDLYQYIQKTATNEQLFNALMSAKVAKLIKFENYIRSLHRTRFFQNYIQKSLKNTVMPITTLMNTGIIMGGITAIAFSAAEKKTDATLAQPQPPTDMAQPVIPIDKRDFTHFVATQNDPLTVRQNPSVMSEKVYALPKGECVQATITVMDDWSKIDLPNDKIGYVAERFLRPITPNTPCPN